MAFPSGWLYAPVPGEDVRGEDLDAGARGDTGQRFLVTRFAVRKTIPADDDCDQTCDIKAFPKDGILSSSTLQSRDIAGNLLKADSPGNWLPIEPGRAGLPQEHHYSSLESVIEQSKEGYYLAFARPRVTVRTDAPDWQPWIMFFLRALHQQMRRLANKVEREKIVLAALPERSVRIIEHAREHGRVTIGDIVRRTGTSRNTLKQHFRQLVAEGYLSLHGSGRGAWYALP